MYSTLLITTYSLSIYKLDNIVNEKKIRWLQCLFFHYSLHIWCYNNGCSCYFVQPLYLKVPDVTPLSPRQAPKAIIFLDQADLPSNETMPPVWHLFDRITEVRFEALTLTRINDKKGNLAGGERKERWEEMEKPSVKCFTAELLHCCLTNEPLVFEWHHWSLFFHSMPSSSSSSLHLFSHTQSVIHRPSLPCTFVSLSTQRRQGYTSHHMR